MESKHGLHTTRAVVQDSKINEFDTICVRERPGSGEWKRLSVNINPYGRYWYMMCVFFFITLAGEAVNVEVCVLDTHHLPTTHLPAALAHDGWIAAVGERRAAVVVSSIKTCLVLNCREETRGERRIKNMSLVVILRLFLNSWSKWDKGISGMPAS